MTDCPSGRGALVAPLSRRYDTPLGRLRRERMCEQQARNKIDNEMKKFMMLMVATFAAMMPLIANEETVVVTFDANGGVTEYWDEWGNYCTGSEPSWTVTKGTDIGNLPYAWYEDDGHFFAGWFDVYGNEFTEDTIVTNDMTVTARWIVDDGSFKILAWRGIVMNYFGTCPAELTADDWPVGVTEIADNTFCGSSLETVYVPASVTSIGNFAFAFCDNLASVTFGNGREGVAIDPGAFDFTP